MNKKVNVTARTPVIVPSVAVPLRGTVRNIVLSEQDIFKCITQKAIVDEILSNGSLVRLSLSNYNKVNEVVKPEPVVVAPAPVEEAVPVIETPEEETTVVAEPEVVIASEEEAEVFDTEETEVVEEVVEETTESSEDPVVEPAVENRPKHNNKKKKK